MSKKTIIYYCLRQGYECFEDYIDSLGIIDRKVYYINPKELNRKMFTDLGVIHIFRYSVPSFLYGNPRVLVLNTEQLSEPTRYNHIAEIVRKGMAIIDYSLANIKILSTRFPSGIFYHLPYQYNPTEVNRLRSFNDNPQIEVGIINCTTPWRKNVLQKLKANGLTVIDVRGWKDVRDRQVGNCKILLNVHFQPGFNIFEHIRCDRWLFAGKPIVSEKCSDPQLLDIAGHIFFTDQLTSTIKEKLQNYEHVVVPENIIEARREKLANFIEQLNKID